MGRRLRRGPEDLPAARREASLAALRSAGAASVAVGLLGLLGTLLAALQVTAASAGNASPAELVAAMGAGLLAPLYGVALRAFLYAPLAEGLAGEGGSVES
ncbi:MAG: hypothetical protein H6828_14890 [Planctomycetes bacterium]|nr:hypothetical protein [Planctomycetota bacterium]